MGIFPDLAFCNNATVVCRVKPCAASVQWTFSGKNITEEMRYVFLGKNSVFEIGMILFFDVLLLPVDFVSRLKLGTCDRNDRV